MKIIVGSDHAGIELREQLIEYLKAEGHEVVDSGTFREKANYAAEGIKVGENVAMNNFERGIVICGTGIGISIAANKVKGVRAALACSVEYARLAREHNDANVLALGARFLTLEEASAITDVFLTTDFTNGRHLDRVETISDYEQSCFDC